MNVPARSRPPHVRVGFVSLGCAKNLVDTQLMAGALLAHGLELAPSPDEADVVVVNTCSFIAAARTESREAIADACRRKREGRCRGVIVTGCLPQRYQGRLVAELPDVDAFLGVDELDRIPETARRVAAGESGIVRVSAEAVRVHEPDARHRVVLTHGPYAYLKVADGCNHRCGFCAIPGIRGRYRSRQVSAIVREAESLLAAGFRELNLVSQDTLGYGRDLGDGTDLVGLLRALDGIGGRFWIRILYGYPTGITDALLAAMAERSRVCRYLDVPIQHADTRILSAMGRAGTARVLPGLADRVRRAMPDAAIRTTCLVGFPGETETEFETLVSFVREMEFDHLGVFVFSPEEGTPACDLPGPVAADIAEARRDRLLAVQRDGVDRRQAARVGGTSDLLVERVEAGRRPVVHGRTPFLAPEVDGEVLVRGLDRRIQPGRFVQVRFTAARGYDLEAEAVRDRGEGI